MKLEARAYGADSSPEERQAIAARVSKISDDLILWNEVPVPSLLSVELMAERVRELTTDCDSYCRVVDLSRAARPSAEVRRRLRQMLAAEDRLRHIAVFTEKNTLINVAVKFVFSGMAKNLSLSVHETYDEALEACRGTNSATGAPSRR